MVIVEVVRIYLEMTDATDLRPAVEVPAVALEPVDNHSPLLREVLHRVGAPHHWSSAVLSVEQSATAMSDPLLRSWLVTVDGEPAGLTVMRAQPGGEVEIVSFGLVPDRVDYGYGGAALTAAVRLAWTLDPADDVPIHRVWLRTNSLDHPNALGNYQRRGFRICRTEHRQKTIPD